MSLRKQPSRFAVRRVQVARTTSLPSPVGGLNARDAIANMPPEDAVVMENFFPLQTSVELRKGWQQWMTGSAATIETLLPYSDVLGNQKLYAVAGGNIYDVTTAGAIGAPVKAGLANSRYSYVNFTNAFNNFLVLVNGQDTPMTFDGTTWAGATYTAPADDAITPENLIQVISHHRRLWFVEKDSTSAWFGRVDEIQGELQRFDMGEMFLRGGYLMALGSWTIDNGQGLNDVLVVVSSEGDAVVFEGFDPESADFRVAGRFYVGKPMGRRCMERFVGDLLILTDEGLVPMSTVVAARDVSGPSVNLTTKIQELISEATTAYAGEFGWQALYVPKLNQLYINVPSTLGQFQYVMNTVTKTWTKFTGFEASCWGLLDGHPFFGFGEGVGKAYEGYLDEYDLGTQTGNDIEARVVQAFSYLGSPGKQKHFKMARPIFLAERSPGVQLNMTVDYEYDPEELNVPAVSSTVDQATWDVSLWDVAFWSGGLTTFKDWFTVNPIGFCGAVAMVLTNSAQTRWAATDILYEEGGVL